MRRCKGDLRKHAEPAPSIRVQRGGPDARRAAEPSRTCTARQSHHPGKTPGRMCDMLLEQQAGGRISLAGARPTSARSSDAAAALTRRTCLRQRGGRRWKRGGRRQRELKGTTSCWEVGDDGGRDGRVREGSRGGRRDGSIERAPRLRCEHGAAAQQHSRHAASSAAKERPPPRRGCRCRP
jgi:hypothetical protein